MDGQRGRGGIGMDGGTSLYQRRVTRVMMFWTYPSSSHCWSCSAVSTGAMVVNEGEWTMERGVCSFLAGSCGIWFS